ncbi:uncharacterized protein KIAA1614 homolog [Brachyistius frenatus]|uniref:uncharacterized protein KIAA1614 homolog n=1 Tax=Brachyistius frenatus TaxID=100188 RepID=UPI0037E77F7F
MCVLSFFVAARLPRQQQCKDGAPMKRHCFPLRGDHNLLTPDTHTLSGVRLHEQVRSEGVASLRRPPAASPTRRLRFEDETETEAESRYLERQRQRRRAGQRHTGVLVSKPELNLYVNSRAGAGPKEAGPAVDRQQKGGTLVRRICQSDPCGTIIGGRVNLELNLHLHPPVTDNRGWSLNRHRLNLRTEQIRETYIGSVTPGETSGGRGGAGHVSNMQVRRGANQVELNGTQVTYSQATPCTNLPVNPYAPPTFRCPSSLSPPSLMMSQSDRILYGTAVGRDQDQDQDQGRPAAAKPQKELQCQEELQERGPCVEDGGGSIRMKNSSSSSSQRSSENKAESQAPPTPGISDGHFSHPMRAQLDNDDVSHFSSRDESSRLSLRRLFSNVRLSRTRTASLDRLSFSSHPSVPDHAPSGTRKSSSLLKKSPSVQSLSVGAPAVQLRKSSSVQSFGSEQKKDRSATYRPVADQFPPRCFSVEDVSLF